MLINFLDLISNISAESTVALFKNIALTSFPSIVGALIGDILLGKGYLIGNNYGTKFDSDNLPPLLLAVTFVTNSASSPSLLPSTLFFVTTAGWTSLIGPCSDKSITGTWFGTTSEGIDIRLPSLEKTWDVDDVLPTGLIWGCLQTRIKLLTVRREGTFALNRKSAIFVAMIQMTTPKTKIRQALVLKVNPMFLTILHGYDPSSTQW